MSFFRFARRCRPLLAFLFFIGLFVAAAGFDPSNSRVKAGGNALGKSIFGNRANLPNIFDVNKPAKGCCGLKKPDAGLIPGLNPEEETYRLTGTYYTLRENLAASLMLNNKGPEPLQATPTFYSLAGTRLSLAPITVPAASYLDVDMHQLLAGAADEFGEGSLKIAYQGGDYQLGAQVKLVNQPHNLIWAEQLVYTSKFTSSRLESVWWLPYQNSMAKVVVSNTSAGTVNATMSVDGTSPHQSAPVQISLAPWETRVLDIMRDIAGHPKGHVHEQGGISIEHSGGPGAVLARMLVGKPNRGYSASIPFVDPENTVSQKWHGNGLRLKNLNGAGLNPVIVARNTSDQPSTVSGRIPYTLPNGEMAEVTLPSTVIAANSTRVAQLSNLIQNSNVPASVRYAGIELEYSTPKGTVITSVQSISQSGDHVYQVPMFDPQKLTSSAGGFPWNADGDYATVVYIKNETDHPKKFTAHLLYAGGQYSLGVRELKPGQTTAIDFRELRDNQTPDGMSRIIPPGVDRGQIAWSVKGPENMVLSGRSEQVSLSEGVASTYSCYNCCPDSVYQTEILPSWIELEFGTNGFLGAEQTDMSCYSTLVGPYIASQVFWNSDNANVISVFDGTLVPNDVGTANISATWETCLWWVLDGQCNPVCDQVTRSASSEVKPKVAKVQYKGPNNSTFTDVTSTLHVLKGTEVSFKAIPDPPNATFPIGRPTWSGSAGATGSGQTKSVTFNTASSSTSNFKTVVATAESSSVTVNVIVYDLAKVVTPDQNFQGRSQTTFGLKEIIILNHTITPSGLTATTVGGLRWAITSGTGTGSFLTVADDGTAEFRAPSSAASSSLMLSVLNGPSKDLNITHSLTTIAPIASVRLEQRPGLLRHTQNVVGAGFKAYIRFDPKNVAFNNIQFSEGACNAATEGYLAGVGQSHSAGITDQILLCNSATGCRAQYEDAVYLGHPTNPSPTPYLDGSWVWPIPWYYHSDGSPELYVVANQVLITDTTGKATISKGGVSVWFNVGDPSANW